MSNQLLPWQQNLDTLQEWFWGDYDDWVEDACMLMNAPYFPKNEQAQLAYCIAFKTLCQGPPETKHQHARECIELALNLQAELKADDIRNGWKPAPLITWLDARADDLLLKINRDEQDPFVSAEQQAGCQEVGYFSTELPSHTTMVTEYNISDSPERSLSPALSTESSLPSYISSSDSLRPPRSHDTKGISYEMLAHFGFGQSIPNFTNDYNPLHESVAEQMTPAAPENREEGPMMPPTQEIPKSMETREKSDSQSLPEAKPIAVSRLLNQRSKILTAIDTAKINEEVLHREVGDIEIVKEESCAIP